MSINTYQSPLSERYASPEMGRIFSAQHKYSTWRRLWLALAQAEKELGLPITNEQLAELSAHLDDIDFDKVAQYEKVMQHDVMAHIHAYGALCPKARPIIHWGATSCYVTDNADLIQMREGLALLLDKLKRLNKIIGQFASKHARLACLAYTHFQPAQLTTLGKRACLWLQDFREDAKELQLRLDNMPFLGVKGATGTQASFLALFHGEQDKVSQLDYLVAEKMGFSHLLTITGQTYPRKWDSILLNALAGIGVSASKCATDLRLLAHLKEVLEPFGTQQVGSSAMPYKRNPILAERVCGLSRFIISLAQNGAYTAATQWLERTLDDSVNRRLTLPEAFLTCDAILDLLIKIFDGLAVNEKAIAAHVEEELPLISLENILMAAVEKGGDRQSLHESLRQYSLKHEKQNLLDAVAQDPAFNLKADEIGQLLSVDKLVGRAPEQVEEFLKEGLI